MNNKLLLIVKKISLIWKIPLIYILLMYIIFPFFKFFIVDLGIFNFLMIKSGRPINFDFFQIDINKFGIYDIVFQISLIFIILIFAFVVDRFSLKDLGVSFNIQSVLKFLAGFLIGGVLIVVCWGILILCSAVEIKGLYWEVNPYLEPIKSYIIYQSIILLLAAFQEELVCRAYLINNFSQSANFIISKIRKTIINLGYFKKKPHLFKIYLSIIPAAIIFSFLHFWNVIEKDYNFYIGILNIFIAGIIYGYYYYMTADLMGAIGVHFGWNFFMGPILGFSISGVSDGKSIMEIALNDKLKIINGGDFGPEGGVVVTVLFIIILITLVFGMNGSGSKHSRNNCKLKAMEN